MIRLDKWVTNSDIIIIEIAPRSTRRKASGGVIRTSAPLDTLKGPGGVVRFLGAADAR
jgi:hypothetical protein